MTTSEQLDIWRQVPTEHETLEFKAARNQYSSERLYEYCIAIANEGGGHLILGVADEPPRSIVGTNAFQNVTETAEKIYEKVNFRVSIDEIQHTDGRVLVFSIPSRPQGTAYHLDGRYLMRVGESLRPMSQDQLRKIFSEGAPDWLVEPSIRSASAQRVIDLLDTQTYFELLESPYPTEQSGVLDRLIKDRLIAREDSGYTIFRIGALMLARNLGDFPDLERKVPRVVVYSGTSKAETKLDQSGSKGYAVGFQGLVHFIMSQLPQNEIVEAAIRKEIKLLPDIVIRELVANALIHQDFTISGTSMMVEIFSDRVVISNPGEPVVPVERFIDGYESRNENLARIMRRMGICEEKSSGIDRVISEAELFQLPAPNFSVGHKRTVVTIYGPRDFEQMDRADRIRACYQHCTLKYVTNANMTNQSLRERFGLPESKSAITSQVITATVEEGIIKPDEKAGKSRKFARYLPFWA